MKSMILARLDDDDDDDDDGPARWPLNHASWPIDIPLINYL